MRSTSGLLAPLALALAMSGGPALAQLPPPSITTPPPLTYGYQPYNPSKPTGFYHPHNMGSGRYHNPKKLKGHRFKSLNYRRFHGY